MQRIAVMITVTSTSAPAQPVSTARNMLVRLIPCLVAIALACACQAGRSTEKIDLLIAGGTVIDPASATAPARIADVAIDDGIIVAVGEAVRRKYDATQVIEAAGEYVIPGLADMHTHFGTGVRAPEADDTKPVLARLLYYGVTTTLNLGSFQAWPERIDALRSEMDRDTLQGPRLLAVGALITVSGSHPTTTIYSPPLQARIAAIVQGAAKEGPIDLAPQTARATTLVRSEADMRAEVQRLGNWGADAIKIVVDSGPPGFGDDHPQMSPQLISAAVQAARRHHIPVLCHVSSFDELESCLDNGAAAAVHAATSTTGIPEDIGRRMASAGMALMATGSLFDGWKNYTKNPALLDDPWLLETLTPAERQWLGSKEMLASFGSDPSRAQRLASLAALVKSARDANVLIVAGTDVGNPYRFPGYSIHEELAFHVAAGLSPAEALATATVNAARLVSDENKWGSIRKGLAADLVILRKNPLDDIANTRTIRHVIRAGRVIDRTALPVR